MIEARTSILEADVVIVGYGPVGVTAANFLGLAGVSVLVVERESSPYPRARAISTDEDVLRCWQRIGLADELKRDMLGNRPIDFVDARGRSFISLAPTPRGYGHPPQMFIYQPALETTLRAGAARFPQVRVLLDHDAGSVRQDDDTVEIDVTELATGERSVVRGRYLLACDGGASPIRTQLGIGFEGRTYADPWVVVDTKVKEPWPDVDHLRFHCDPERPAVDCPTPLGHHRWEFPILPGEDPDEVCSDASLWRLLARHQINERQVTILRRAVYVHHVRLADRWRSGRVLLLGDAAHCMPPWIGQGMASGVRDADNLCWKLAAVLDGSAVPELLDSYEQEQKPLVRLITQRAVQVGQIITERRRAVAAARNVVFRAAMRTPGLRGFIHDGRWLGMPSHRRGLFDVAARQRFSIIGERLPQPVVEIDGQLIPLDDALGRRWTVLARTGRPAEGWRAAGAEVFVLGRDLIDRDGSLAIALGDADAVVLRPDQFIYTAVGAGEPLPAPPSVLQSRPVASVT